MTRSQVVAEAGEPDAHCDPNVWVYWEIRAVAVVRTHPHLDTLLVVFSGERVAWMKLVEAGPVRMFLARKKGT